MFPRPPLIKKWPTKFRISAAACMLSLALTTSGFQGVKANQARFVALDIGQGDALYVRTPSGHDLLIDGGPNARTADLLKAQMLPGDKKIDAVFATHLDADHSGGLASVIEATAIEKFLYNGAEPKTKTAQNLFDVLKKKAIKPTILSRGMRIQSDGWFADVLWPPADFQSTQTNEEGIVLRLRTEKETILLTADISEEIEELLLERHTPLTSAVLKVGHHGSKTSSSGNFLAAVGADTAVISVGANNRYGHPTSDALERLADFGLKIFRTDEAGAVSIPLK